jgi:cob(I)alamin adenosyltransferase
MTTILYTKKGDKGTTSLYDMRNVDKTDDILTFLGSMDELSCHIGLLRVQKNLELSDTLFLRKIQANILNINSDVATCSESNRKRLVCITEEDVKALEEHTDYFNSKCGKLTEFILPGINTEESLCHIARAVSRRCEQNLWRVKDRIKTDVYTFQYMNRLSSFFFGYARFLAKGTDHKRGKQ